MFDQDELIVILKSLHVSVLAYHLKCSYANLEALLASYLPDSDLWDIVSCLIEDMESFEQQVQSWIDDGMIDNLTVER